MMKRFTMLLALLFLFGTVWAQKTVTGTVKDDKGSTLVGVNVLLQGTTTGTVTDIDGNYQIDVPSNEAVLVFSSIGYETRTEVVGTRSIIDYVLAEDVELLEEVVVSALGFKQQKDQMGATFSQVKTEDITRSGETLLLNSLAGKASNVQISSSNGDPGAGTTIRIRGANTISGSSDPLIIIDGIPVSNSTIYGADIGGNEISGGRSGGVSQQSRLNDINPSDIESIQVLKGASAAALWGSRAANGVVVITTKSGQQGKLKINYKTSYSWDKVHEKVPLQNVWGQGRNGSYSPTLAEAWGDYIPDRSGGADELDQTGQFFEADNGRQYYPILTKNSRETFENSNFDKVFQTGGFWQNDLTISGGNEKATIFVSLGSLDQDGIARNSNYKRYNARLNATYQLNDWFNMSTKAGYTKSSSNRIQQNSNVTGLMLGLLRTPPDFDISDYRGTYFDDDGVAFPNRHRAYRRYLGGSSPNPIYNNPLWTLFEQSATSEVNRFLMSTELNISPKDWLQFTLRGGVDNSNDKRVYLYPIGSASDRNNGYFAEDVIRELQLNFDAIAKGNFDLTSDISLQATLGWNINDRKRTFNATDITGFLVNSKKPTTALNAAAENSTIQNRRLFRRSNRGYGQMSFDLWDQLFVNLSGAVEAASSVQGTFFYPAFDAAWQFSDKLDLSNSPISFGKVRASWGRVGVQPLAHRFQTLAETSFSYSTYSDPLDIGLFGGGFRIDDDKGNPDLEPEIKDEWELGLDTRLFEDRLSLGMTYYQNKITGILISVSLTPSSGFDTEYTNAASMENKGFEFEIDYSIFRNSDWDVGLFANWSTNRNEVTKLTGTDNINLTVGASVSSRAVVGEPLGVLFGTGSQADENGNLILDSNGFPQITPSPVVLGDPNPDWRSGFGLRANWKNFGINVLFDHQQGGEFSPRTLWVLRRFGTTEETANRLTLTQDLVNYGGDVISSGTTVRGNVADFGGGPVILDETWYRTGIGGGFGDNQAYNFSIADATNTRLRELTLSYTLKSPSFVEKTRLSSVTISATGRNLWLWDDIEGIDPQINQYGVSNGFGLDYFTNPVSKSFLVSLSISY